jgi:hypothetical protein
MGLLNNMTVLKISEEKFGLKEKQLNELDVLNTNCNL